MRTENSIKIIKQIERTHRGLGIPILFGDYCVVGGISPMYIGEVGTGKGTAIKAISRNHVKPMYDVNMNSVTLTQLAHKIASVKGETLIWRFPEWSTLSKYHRELFLTVGSHIITDHEYYHEMGERKGVPIVIDVKDCTLISLIGIQPLKMGKMMRENENWESLASDRFLKFAMFNPLREDTIEKQPIYDFPTVQYEKDLPITTPLVLLKNLLGTQVSEERLPIFARHLMRAFCAVEGYDTATLKSEMELVKLIRPYLEIYPKMVYTQDIEEEKTFASGAYRLFLLIAKHDGITVEQARDNFKVYNKVAKPTRYALEAYDKMIMRHANLLSEFGLIFITKNSPTSFHLSNKLNEYFNWYRGLTN